MKTILVVYTNTKLTRKEAQAYTQYAFNISSRVKVGDMLDSDDYITPIQVVKVLPRCYRYVNVHNGNLSNKREACTKQYKIRTLAVKEENKK